jgi:tetratricopeptide (TPR) repeat protein
LIQAGQVVEAKLAIDSAFADEGTKQDPEAWYIKGFIYKEVYKKQDAGSRSMENRLIAVDAFKKSMELDKENQKLEENKKNLRIIANSYYNDAAALLPDTASHQRAQAFYGEFKKAMALADPGYNFQKKDIEFKLFQAQIYSKQYDVNRKVGDHFLEKAKTLYNEVLGLDSNNFSANYNLGILYYNQAVNIINEMDYDVDIFELGNTQDQTLVLFKKSLPYMQKAYNLDPSKRETLIGLAGIYYSLNEDEKSKAFKALADQMTPDKK